MKPEVKVFSKDAPCTKLEIWQTFRGPKGFKPNVPVVEAQAIIGANVPRVMEREGRLYRHELRGVEYYSLTDAGEEWLLDGMQRYLKNHPTHAAQADFLPASWGYSKAPARLRRTR